MAKLAVIVLTRNEERSIKFNRKRDDVKKRCARKKKQADVSDKLHHRKILLRLRRIAESDSKKNEKRTEP